MKADYFVETKIVVVCLAGMLTLVLVTGSMMMNEKNGKIKSMEMELSHYHNTYLSKGGSTSLYDGTMLNYDLRSFDGGKTWFAINTFSKKFKILGEVETVYPGLMKNLKAWDALVEYAKENGPIGSKQFSDSSMVEILKDANIKIVKK